MDEHKGDKYVLSEPSPEHFDLELTLTESIVLAIIGQTQHLDITVEEQENIAQAVMDVLSRFANDHRHG